MDVHHIARGVVQHLPGWAYQDNGSYVATLKRADGARLSLRLDRGRLSISGFYPIDVRPHDQPEPTITVAAERAPQAIAGEIKRRFLPEYDPLYAKALAAQERDRRNFLWEVATSERLAGLLGARYVTPTANARYDERTSVRLGLGEDLALTFHAHAYDRTIRLERASLPVELFERLAVVIAA